MRLSVDDRPGPGDHFIIVELQYQQVRWASKSNWDKLRVLVMLRCSWQQQVWCHSKFQLVIP